MACCSSMFKVISHTLRGYCAECQVLLEGFVQLCTCMCTSGVHVHVHVHGRDVCSYWGTILWLQECSVFAHLVILPQALEHNNIT